MDEVSFPLGVLSPINNANSDDTQEIRSCLLMPPMEPIWAILYGQQNQSGKTYPAIALL